MLHCLFHKTSLCTYIWMLIAHFKSKKKSISIFIKEFEVIFVITFWQYIYDVYTIPDDFKRKK